MVSFQCDACQDVVKKPKLDNHSFKCHASFTCVDCSKTFRTRSEWKGHTSCISEAEKYQKGLYKGKKTQQNGSTGKDVNKSKESQSKSITVQSAPTSENRVNSTAQDVTDSAVIDGVLPIAASEPVFTEDTRTKEASKDKKKRKTDETAATRTNEGVEPKKKRKKVRKLDAADIDGKTEKPRDDASKSDSSSPTYLVPRAAESRTPGEEKKEKKERKEKKRKKDKTDKESSMKSSERQESGAPAQADSHPASTEALQKSDNPPSEKAEKEEAKSNPSERGRAESVPTPTDGEAIAKKTRRRKRKSKGGGKDSSESDDKKHGTGVEHTAPDLKRKQPDEANDDGAAAAKKAKKERKKERKRKAKTDSKQVENS